MSDFPRLAWDEDFEFPDPVDADEDGLVGVGGNLSAGMLLSAYRRGLFPWFSRDGAPFWYCPDPRFVLLPAELHVGETLKKVLKKKTFEVTFDSAFSSVMKNCSEVPRPGQDGTWITDDFLEGYSELHRLGFAHSVEVWRTGSERHLVGGLYGIHLGRVFYGESMFSLEPNASKVGFVTVVRWLVSRFGVELIDCQAPTAYLATFGAKKVSRAWFLERLRALGNFPGEHGRWCPDQKTAP